jgi:hypothetical protein
VKLFGAVTVACGALLLSSIANAQVANSQTDSRDYEALAHLPKDTLVALTYFREASTSDKQSFSQSERFFERRTSSIRAEKAALLLLQYNHDIEETGGASIGKFIGARLSHAIFFDRLAPP